MSASAAERRARASGIIANQRLKERERWICLWNYIHKTEIEDGTQFLRSRIDGALYVVLGTSHQVLSLPRAGRGGDGWHAYFQTMYGYGERENVAKFIYDVLRSYCQVHGILVELRRFAAFDQATQTVYLSAYNGQIFKIEASDQISTRIQGEDGIFFADDDGGTHVDPEIGDHGIFLEVLARPNFTESNASGITADQQRMALIIWMFMLAFPDLMPTKPILLVEGVKGSGKTSVITLLQIALMGVKQPIILQKNKEDDFGVELERSPIALLDNLDSYIEWLPDAICAYTTSGVWNKRVLYTDDKSMIIKPHAFIAVATRNPASFRRDDVVDRCVILRFDRRPGFTRLAKLEADILADRPKLLGEYLWHVGKIVEEIRRDSTLLEADETHRMADFVAFGRAVGRAMKWDEDAVTDLMEALQAERDAFLNEEDPLVDLLLAWIKHPNGGRSNIGRQVDVFQLHTELEAFAEMRSLPWKETPRTLTTKIQSTHIERQFRVEKSNVGGHRAFRIWRHSDTKLEVVPFTGIPAPMS